MTLHPDVVPYYRFTSKSRLDKDLNELFGIVEGIAIDGRINEKETAYLQAWLRKNEDVRRFHPYDEFFRMLEEAIEDGFISESESRELCAACRILVSNEYFSLATGKIQHLHGMLAGILSDGVISLEEIDGLRRWMDLNMAWQHIWPLDELGSMLDRILSDGRLDEAERRELDAYFRQFVRISPENPEAAPRVFSENLNALIEMGTTLQSVLEPNPEIAFSGRTFCFTGSSIRCRRSQMKKIVEKHGGNFADSLTRNVDYLVVGTAGNPCWAFSAYGRKIEMALELKKKGCSLLIVHEDDFQAALKAREPSLFDF